MRVAYLCVKENAFAAIVPDDPDTSLSALTVGSLTLSPAFDKSKTEYTAATTTATNTVSATASDPDAAIEIKNGSSTVTNGTAATWASGENVVTVKIINRSAVKTYTVTVTKS